MTAMPASLAAAGDVQGDRGAADEQFALVRLVHTGEHLHHGGLARAVLADQRVRLPGVQVGGPVHHRMHRAEGLHRVPQRKHRPGLAGRCALGVARHPASLTRM